MIKPKATFNSAFLMTWWLPIIVALIVVLGTVLVLIPQVSQVIVLREDLQKSKDQLVLAQNKISAISKIDKTEVDQYLELSDSALPEHKPYFEVLALMQRLSSETGAALGKFDFSPGSLSTASASSKEVGSGYVALQTQVSVEGTTEQVSQFTEKLQQAMPIVSVKSIDIGGEELGGADSRRAQLTIEIYYSHPIQVKSTSYFDPLPPFETSKRDVFTTLAGYVVPVEASVPESVVDFSRENLFSY